MNKNITVIIPTLNEEKYILNCLESIEKQDYPLEFIEVYIVDGISSDNTVKLVKQFEKKSKFIIKIFNNPLKIQSSAMNIGIYHSTSDLIIRLDAHTIYEKNYISVLVNLHHKYDVLNIGFPIITKGNSKIGVLISKVLSSKFGVGGSDFRIGVESNKFVSTVPFGAFKRETFQKIGLFNENLKCNEDNDINARIEKSGSQILLSTLSYSTYYCRDSIIELVKMAIRNGKWNVYSLYYSPQSMKFKYFVPFLFSISLFFNTISIYFDKVFLFLLILELMMYFIVSFFESKKIIGNLFKSLQLSVIFFIFHFSYGLGSVFGVFGYLKLLFTKPPKFKSSFILSKDK